jgi:hypothetical protein
MSLCRHYVRELRRSILVSTPDIPSEGDSNRPPIDFPDDGDDKDSDQRLSAFLRTESPEHGLRRRSVSDNQETPSTDHPSLMASSARGPTNSSSITHTVNRADIQASAEKILYTYLLRGAEREIVLPDPILQSISHAIEVDGRDDPDVFNEAKDYVFQAMERDAFPGFLRSKALGNLVPTSVMLRLVVGLLGMFGGFWAAFALIFLDIRPRATRLWVSATSSGNWVIMILIFRIAAHRTFPCRCVLTDGAPIFTGPYNGLNWA